MFGIDDAIAAVSSLAESVVTRIWPDATEKERLKAQQIASEMQHEFNLLVGQLEINKIEAQNPSVFVSGWRPFIGWSCGIALCYAAILEPFGRFIAVVMFGYVGDFPVVDTDITLQILLGLLGLAGMRSFEKSKGIARKN